MVKGLHGKPAEGGASLISKPGLLLLSRHYYNLLYIIIKIHLETALISSDFYTKALLELCSFDGCTVYSTC